MNRYAIALLLTMIVAGLAACGSADDPAQRIEKHDHEAQVAPQEK